MTLSTNKKKFLKSLQLKKFRNEHGVFLVEGEKLFQELLLSTFVIEEVFATDAWHKANHYRLPNELDFTLVTEKDLAAISSFKTPQHVIAVVKQQSFQLTKNKHQPIIVLDNIQDPGNLGTIIRTMDWFGYENLVCSPTCVELYNPKVVQATMGSIFRVNTVYQQLNVFFKEHQHFSIYGALLNGENCFNTNLSKSNSIIVLGNESKGISREILPFINKKITIPKFGNAESLNVSIAAGILLAEFSR